MKLLFLSFSKDMLIHKYYSTFRYKKWLPDNTVRQDTKITYQVEIRYANNTNITHTFHGPRGKTPYPVNITVREICKKIRFLK